MVLRKSNCNNVSFNVVQMDIPEIKDRSDAYIGMEISSAIEPDEYSADGFCKCDRMALLIKYQIPSF